MARQGMDDLALTISPTYHLAYIQKIVEHPTIRTYRVSIELRRLTSTCGRVCVFFFLHMRLRPIVGQPGNSSIISRWKAETVQLSKRAGFDDVGHRLGLTTGAQISVCKAPQCPSPIECTDPQPPDQKKKEENIITAPHTWRNISG